MTIFPISGVADASGVHFKTYALTEFCDRSSTFTKKEKKREI